ncbi:unnamed protein product [Ectocarpus sp. CCAP 1310/34]|nr:unnamed protein product [Ectocarpus sp. CCAP 1310/34]
MACVTTAQTCDNGLAGVSNGDYCCTLGCGTCGGPGCSTRAEGLDGNDCCTANIAQNGILCAESGAAPCIGDVEDDVPTETETMDPSYLGCYSDPADSRMFVQDISSDAMTAECWCGAEGADYDANGEGVCDTPCGGNDDEICGGFYAMSVYENAKIDDPSYLGCYSDPADSRMFVQDISSDAMTAEVSNRPGCFRRLLCGIASASHLNLGSCFSRLCFVMFYLVWLEACAGSAYYGTQYSVECWCGAEGADYDANGEGICDIPCSGDVNEICGGFYAMSVYENADDGVPNEFSCSGDAGVSFGTSCCEADCGTCGGTGCSMRGSGAASCCTSSIQAAGTLCSDSGAAPCIL